MARLRPAHVALVSLALLAAVAAIHPARASATAIDDFRQARAAYEDHEYARAVELLENLLLPTPEFEDPILVQEARKYLGAAYVFVGRRDEAQQQFTEYLRAEPSLARAELDPSLFTVEVLGVFDRVRERMIEEAREAAVSEAAENEANRARRRSAMLELLALAQTDEVEVEVDPLFPWVPFGVGQFNNGNEGLGLFFAISESLFATTAAVTAAAWIPLFDEYERSLRLEEGARTIDAGLLIGLQALNWVSVGMTVGLGVAGVIEAHLSYRPTRTERRQRDVPPELLQELRLVLGPTSISLDGRF